MRLKPQDGPHCGNYCTSHKVSRRSAGELADPQQIHMCTYTCHELRILLGKRVDQTPAP